MVDAGCSGDAILSAAHAVSDRDFKVGAAAAIHPNALAVVAPGTALHASGAAVLFDQLHAAARIRGAIVAMHVVGSTVNCRCRLVGVATAAAAAHAASDGNFKIGAAAAIHPNAPAIRAPGTPLDAFRTAALLYEPHAAVAARVTNMAMHVIGGAIDADGVRLIVPVAVVVAAANFKVGAAAAVHPDAAVVVAPGRAIETIGIAALADQPHAVAGVGIAVMHPHIVRGACGGLRRSRAVPVRAAELEVRAAPAIHPNAAAVVPPGTPVRAIGVTAAAREADPVARVHGTEVASHVIGSAIDRVALAVAAPVRYAGLEIGAAAAVHPDAAVIVAPSPAEIAWRTAALAHKLHAAARVRLARVPVHVVRRASDGLRLGRREGSRRSFVRTSHEKEGDGTREHGERNQTQLQRNLQT